MEKGSGGEAPPMEAEVATLAPRQRQAGRRKKSESVLPEALPQAAKPTAAGGEQTPRTAEGSPRAAGGLAVPGAKPVWASSPVETLTSGTVATTSRRKAPVRRAGSGSQASAAASPGPGPGVVAGRQGRAIESREESSLKASVASRVSMFESRVSGQRAASGSRAAVVPLSIRNSARNQNLIPVEDFGGSFVPQKSVSPSLTRKGVISSQISDDSAKQPPVITAPVPQTARTRGRRAVLSRPPDATDLLADLGPRERSSPGLANREISPTLGVQKGETDLAKSDILPSMDRARAKGPRAPKVAAAPAPGGGRGKEPPSPEPDAGKNGEGGAPDSGAADPGAADSGEKVAATSRGEEGAAATATATARDGESARAPAGGGGGAGGTTTSSGEVSVRKAAAGAKSKPAAEAAKPAAEAAKPAAEAAKPAAEAAEPAAGGDAGTRKRGLFSKAAGAKAATGATKEGSAAPPAPVTKIDRTFKRSTTRELASAFEARSAGGIIKVAGNSRIGGPGRDSRGSSGDTNSSAGAGDAANDEPVEEAPLNKSAIIAKKAEARRSKTTRGFAEMGSPAYCPGFEEPQGKSELLQALHFRRMKTIQTEMSYAGVGCKDSQTSSDEEAEEEGGEEEEQEGEEAEAEEEE